MLPVARGKTNLGPTLKFDFWLRRVDCDLVSVLTFYTNERSLRVFLGV